MSNGKKHIALSNKKIIILSYVNFGLSPFFWVYMYDIRQGLKNIAIKNGVNRMEGSKTVYAKLSKDTQFLYTHKNGSLT